MHLACAPFCLVPHAKKGEKKPTKTLPKKQRWRILLRAGGVAELPRARGLGRGALPAAGAAALWLRAQEADAGK